MSGARELKGAVEKTNTRQARKKNYRLPRPGPFYIVRATPRKLHSHPPSKVVPPRSYPLRRHPMITIQKKLVPLVTEDNIHPPHLKRLQNRLNKLNLSLEGLMLEQRPNDASIAFSLAH